MVARRAVAAAASATAAAAAPRQREPGFYLLAGGRAGFEILIGYHTPFNRWPQLLNRACGIMGYAGAITLVAGALLALPLALLAAQGVGTLALALLTALGIIPPPMSRWR